MKEYKPPKYVLIRNVATGEVRRFLKGPKSPQGWAKVIDIVVPGLKARKNPYDGDGYCLPEYDNVPLWESSGKNWYDRNRPKYAAKYKS